MIKAKLAQFRGPIENYIRLAISQVEKYNTYGTDISLKNFTWTIVSESKKGKLMLSIPSNESTI